MNKIKAALMMFLALSLITAGQLDVCASGMITSPEDAVSSYIDDFRQKTKCDSVSVIVYDSGEVRFYGNENSLYQIGSMTKAFTGLGIYKLIEEGTINHDSRVSEFIPGFTAIYESKPQEITIDELLDQTSGYTNAESDYPSAEEGMTLNEWALGIWGKELKSAPGSEYAYSNVNFNLLGAVIEQATGLSYKEYMESEVLIPLGLEHTYVSLDRSEPGASSDGESGSDPAAAPGVISGSRLAYRHSFKYDIPVVEGRIPAGYFYSDTADMARWMEIWLGKADIPDEYQRLVNAVKEHLDNTGDYHSGWEKFENGCIGHSGGTPNYSSRIVFSEDDKVGVCVLTNLNVAASTDGLCNGIFEMVVNGALEDPGSAERMSVPTDVWTVFDIIFSCVTAAGVILIVTAAIIRKRSVIIVLGITAAVLVILICTIMPLVFGAGLKEILFTWAPYSMTGGIIALILSVIAACVKFWKLRNRNNEDRTKRS